MAEYLNLNKDIIQPLNINQLQLQLQAVLRMLWVCSSPTLFQLQQANGASYDNSAVHSSSHSWKSRELIPYVEMSKHKLSHIGRHKNLPTRSLSIGWRHVAFMRFVCMAIVDQLITHSFSCKICKQISWVLLWERRLFISYDIDYFGQEDARKQHGTCHSHGRSSANWILNSSPFDRKYTVQLLLR